VKPLSNFIKNRKEPEAQALKIRFLKINNVFYYSFLDFKKLINLDIIFGIQLPIIVIVIINELNRKLSKKPTSCLLNPCLSKKNQMII